jgi:hypothetical protein
MRGWRCRPTEANTRHMPHRFGFSEVVEDGKKVMRVWRLQKKGRRLFNRRLIAVDAVITGPMRYPRWGSERRRALDQQVCP